MIANNFVKNNSSSNFSKDKSAIYSSIETINLQPGLQKLSHWQDDMEIIFILTGEMEIFCGMNVTKLTKGDSFIINPQVMHHVAPHKGNDCRFLRLWIHPAIFTGNNTIRTKLMLSLMEGNRRDFFYIPHDHELGEKAGKILMHIYELNSVKSPAYELEIIGLLHILLSKVYALSPAEKDRNIVLDNINMESQKRMISFINANYGEKIKLNEIAKAGNVSRSKCCVIFKKYMQQSPIEYLNDYRLEMSCMLLRKTNDSILDISSTCGFTTQSYFTKMFTQKYNITPRAFKLKAKKEEVEMKTPPIKIVKKNGYKIEGMFGQKIIFTTDLPDENGNKQAPTPGQLAVASIACCALSIITLVTGEKGLNIDGAYAETSQNYDKARNRLSKIFIKFHLPSSIPENIRMQLEKAVEEECTVSRSFRPDMLRDMKYFYDISN